MGKILLGLDIGNNLIKSVQIIQDNKKNILLAAGYIASPAFVKNTQEHDTAIANAINRLVHNMKPSSIDVSVSLPSTKVTTRIIEIPVMSENELQSSLQWEAEQYIPWQLSQVKLDYIVTETDEANNKMKILLVAAPISLIERYMNILKMAGLNPVSLEPDVLSSTRIVSDIYSDIPNILYVSIGSVTTDINIIHNKSLIYTKSYPVGGNTFTKSVAEELGFEMTQAEEYKKTYGLDEELLESKIYKIISPLFMNIIDEIEKTVSYIKEIYPKDDIRMAVLGGGTARLPGLLTFVAKNTGLDTQLMNPFMKLKVDPNIVPIIQPDAPLYTNAVGLAIKAI